MRLTVEVTNPELDALEDVLAVWNLCPRHVVATSSRRQKSIWQSECPECRKIRAVKVEKSLVLWSRLCRAYDSHPSVSRRTGSP